LGDFINCPALVRPRALNPGLDPLALSFLYAKSLACQVVGV
jgi:hypothetical protein